MSGASKETAKLRNPVDLQLNATALVGFLEKQAKQKLNLNIAGDMQWMMCNVDLSWGVL